MSVAELTSKIERLSVEDYNMVVMLIDRLSSQDDSLRKLSADEMVVRHLLLLLARMLTVRQNYRLPAE